MFLAYVVVTIAAAAANISIATADFLRSEWVLDNMTKVALPHSWAPLMGVLKAAGALGLLVGIGVPPLGIAAAVGLILFFVGAIIAHVRAGAGAYHFPGTFLLLAVGSLVLRLASS